MTNNFTLLTDATMSTLIMAKEQTINYISKLNYFELKARKL